MPLPPLVVCVYVCTQLDAHRYGIILLQLTEKPRKVIKTADT